MELPQIIIRSLQFLWTLIITALIGNVIATNNDGHMAAINFTMFVAVLSWLSLLYGIVAAVVESISMPIALMALDGLTALFTLIDGIVLAALLSAVKCGDDHHDKSPSWIAFGSEDTEKRCRELQASTAFMWFLWATVAGSLSLLFLGFRRAGGSIRSVHPHMSQLHV